MATPNHLLKDWDGFTPGSLLFSFDDAQKREYAFSNSHEYSVADWRVNKPIFNAEHCIHCQFCWIYCPDTSIISVDKKFSHIDLAHCKGCGICVEVCPTNPKSLLMFAEHTNEADALASWPAKEKKQEEEK